MGKQKPGRYVRDLSRQEPSREQARTFFILVEGRETERFYFEELCRYLGLKSVRVVPYRATNPIKFVEEAIRLAKVRAASGMSEKFDEVWAVFDTEGQSDGRIPHLTAARKRARQGKVQLAISNPSFEFWVRLHFSPTTAFYANGDKLCHEIEKVHCPGYDKLRPPMKVLLPRTKAAIENARHCEEHHASYDGDGNPSSGIYKLLLALNAAVSRGPRLF
jgi:hypothetical protein